MGIVSHTPGPWAVSKKKARRVTNLQGLVICNAVLRNQGGPKSKANLKDEHEAEANALLISAAPDLLNACSDLLSLITGDISGAAQRSSIIAEASRAIQKATESPNG